MAYFRVLSSQIAELQKLYSREEAWCILIMADPDALASAMALKRLIRPRVRSVTIAHVNKISRPDNLAMIRHLRIPAVKWRPSLARKFQRYAMVDSQPQHSPAFPDVEYSIIIDHHPHPLQPHQAVYQDIRPSYGSVSTMMTEYLYSANIRPGRLLATALQYGIRTDTGTFGRQCTETDLRAYQYLSRFGDPAVMTRILRSEYLPQWLPYFSSAIETMRPCGRGSYAWLGKVASPDLLVVVADFFLRVHGLRWVAVCGTSAGRLVVVFRGGDGLVDLGSVAALTFENMGSGGGHSAMARAEMAVADVPREHRNSVDAFTFHCVYEAAERYRASQRLRTSRKREESDCPSEDAAMKATGADGSAEALAEPGAKAAKPAKAGTAAEPGMKNGKAAKADTGTKPAKAKAGTAGDAEGGGKSARGKSDAAVKAAEDGESAKAAEAAVATGAQSAEAKPDSAAEKEAKSAKTGTAGQN